MHLRFIPWVLLIVGFILWVLPGVIQWLGAEDRNWASICNQIIGTGSVLLGVVMYTARKLFTQLRGFRAAIKGELTLKNDAAARWLAPQYVKTVRHVACDPRLPRGLIAESSNSAVRVDRRGWLRIGRKIPVKSAHEHCYHVVMDKGVVLDLLDGKIYKMKTTKNGDEVILRRNRGEGFNEEWTPHVVRDHAKIV